MNNWQRWLQAPHTHWLRKLLFQVHLWLGIGLGLYVLLISLSGSAILLNSPFYGWFEPRDIENPPQDVIPLAGQALTDKMIEVYAGSEVGFTVEAMEPGRATYVVVNKDGEYSPHYFNQYTGEDIGVANPWPIKSVEWLAGVHADLLMGRTGRRVNGVGGLLFILMSCSGVLIWWQGRSRWYDGLLIRAGSKRGVIWQLHSFLGFWALLLMVAWGVSGFQLGFPAYMDKLVDWLDRDLSDFERPTRWLQFFRSVHFARFGETALTRWAWIVASFVPTIILVSGCILWWKRVVLKQVRQVLAKSG
jgi:uncharacterized iron-regulated membrane protein